MANSRASKVFGEGVDAVNGICTAVSALKGKKSKLNFGFSLTSLKNWNLLLF